MVNRWNKAIAVGLRHNHDISFIATQRKTMALMYYVTNYATKVEDPDDGGGAVGDDAAKEQDATVLDEVANRVFTERPLSQVEVVAHLLGYPAEFTNSSAWAYLNTSLLYWEVFRRWPYLRRASGAAAIDDTLDESVLRRPGKHATVCLDGYLSKDFGHNDDESCHRRAAVQHLALFVPWESFLCEETAEDAKRDAKQWAASSGDGDSTVAHVEEGETGEAGAEFAATYRSNNIGDATRLIDVVRGAVGTNQVTAKSPELMAMMRQLCRFQQSALCSTAELEAIAIPEQGLRCISMPGRSGKAIAELRCGGDDRLREDDVEMTTADSDETASDAEAGMRVSLAHRPPSSRRAGVVNTANAEQEAFVGGEGGTGKSRIIGALVELFSGKSLSNRLLITATSGTAAAQINGITIHSACGFTKDRGRAARTQPRTLTGCGWQNGRSGSSTASLGWTGRRRTCLSSTRKISGIPIVLFCGDFQQFRPDKSVDRPAERGHLVGRRQLVQGRAAAPARQSARAVEEIHDADPAGNRWNLNMEASLAFRVQQRSTMRIFISEHKWKEGLPTEEEAIMGLKLVNGAGYSAVEVIVDKASPGHRISSDMTIHFGPPAGYYWNRRRQRTSTSSGCRRARSC
ncbi:PIF1-like helicase [Hirsutella rhossiliensis]|uniref:ATP-dependent DNA helicase n=1 Tax=Hirsutella rhossiliensis TaxID=111463 RepID=A0A9P8SHH8_9HYPO|nr:PIF1-like helicase domain-containing protein [Hirsutella rhossiliensis]KAH0962851.1 PIF1-like helicase domain-containing protein [Hirsutella rhossiliensis]